MAESSLELNIFNLALSHLGQPLITAGSEQPVLPFLYPFVRDKALSWAPWSFARTRQRLVLHADTPPDDEFLYQYVLPTSPRMLRVLDIDCKGFEYQREVYVLPSQPQTQTPVILTSAPSVVLKYIAATDPGVWSALFVDTVGLWLALAASQRISKTTALRTQLFAELQTQLGRAIDIDGHQDSPPRHLNETYIDVRGPFHLPILADFEEDF